MLPDHAQSPRIRVVRYDRERIESRDQVSVAELAALPHTEGVTWIEIRDEHGKPSPQGYVVEFTSFREGCSTVAACVFGFLALVLVFGFRSFGDVVREGREHRDAERAAGADAKPSR